MAQMRAALLLLTVTVASAAKPPTRNAENSCGVFMGGEYIEIGIRKDSQIGKFGTGCNAPSPFLGRYSGSGIGMVGDDDGLGVGVDLRCEYFLPGSPEESFQAGYKIGGTQHGSFKNFGSRVTQESTSALLQATIHAVTSGGHLKVEQKVQMMPSAKYFKNTVTLTNLHTATLSDVRFMRTQDPDNTVDHGGSFVTIQKIEKTCPDDGIAVVSATSMPGGVYARSKHPAGKQSVMLYMSDDCNPATGEAVGSAGGIGSAGGGLQPRDGVWNSMAYKNPQAKGSTATMDAFIALTFGVASLAPGKSATFSMLTALSAGAIDEIIDEVADVTFAPATPAPTTAAPEEPSLPTLKGDPFIEHAGRSTQVWLPLQQPTPLIRAHGEWELVGTAVGDGVAGSTHQWFRAFDLRHHGEAVLSVLSSPAALLANRGVKPSDALLRSINVKARGQGLTNLTSGSSMLLADDVLLQARCVVGCATDLPQEEIEISALSRRSDGSKEVALSFTLTSSPAAKFANWEDQVQNIHLDLALRQFNASRVDGVLPEVWGLLPMSVATARLLSPPQ